MRDCRCHEWCSHDDRRIDRRICYAQSSSGGERAGTGVSFRPPSLVRSKPTAFGRATLRGSADTGRTGPPSGIVEGTICLDPRTVHAFSLRRRRCTPEPRVSAAASRRSATLGNERNQIPYAEGVIQDSWRLLIFVERLRRTRFSNYDPGCAAHHGCAVAPATLGFGV